MAAPPTCISRFKKFHQSVVNRRQISVSQLNQIIYTSLFITTTTNNNNNVFEPTCDVVLMGAALPAPDRQAPDEAESGNLEPVQFLP